MLGEPSEDIKKKNELLEPTLIQMHYFFISIHRELRRVIAHPRYPLLLTLGIIFSYVFFITLTEEGQPEKLPIAVVDQDGSYLSRRLCHELNATQGVRVVACYNTHSEARRAMQRQEIYAFMEIPAGTYSRMLDFDAPHVAIYTNNAFLLAGSLSYKTLATMGKLASGAVQREVLRKKGLDEKTIMGLIQPVQFDAHNIGNPMASYQPYLMTTILPGIVALMVLLLTVFQVALEQKEGTAQEWVDAAGGNIVTALAGKLAPYTFWFVLLGTVGNIIFFGPMEFALNGSMWMMVLDMVLLVLAAQWMGVLLVSFIPDLHLATCFAAIYGALSFTMAGFSFPVESMIAPLQGFSYLFPLRQYYLIYAKTAIYGGGMAECWMNVCLLMGFVLAGLASVLLLIHQSKKGVEYAK